MKNEVSLCMIVKNEEYYLPRCLESIKDIVDEIIIVDTGSTDKTIEIAKSFGAKVYFFKWNNNFSEARNESLKYASKEWILILDADDELFPEDQSSLKEFLAAQLSENEIYNFETLNYFGDNIDDNSITVNLNPRLFKNHQGIHYEGEVHNQLVCSKDKYNVIYNRVQIHHYGYMNKTIDVKDKRNRTISLLNEQIKKDPNNYFAYFNLGTEYAGLDESQKALDYYCKAYEGFSLENGYSFLLILRIVILSYKLKDFDNALKFADIGIDYYPKFTDLYFFKAFIFRDLNKPLSQIEMLKKCIEIGEAPSELKCFYGTGSFKAFFELGCAYFKLNDDDTAYSYFNEAIKIKSDFYNPLYHIGLILQNRNIPLEDFKRTMESFLDDYPKSYLVISDIFINLGYFEIALEYINRYEETQTLKEDLMLTKAKYLVMTGKFNECIATKSISKSNSWYLHISMYKVLSSILINDVEGAVHLLNSLEAEGLSVSNSKLFKVYTQLIKLLKKEDTQALSEDENDNEYYILILEILEILLKNSKIKEFQTAINLLNLIENKSALLYLGKLYYNCGYTELAKKELLRSIKEFEVYDDEALDMLKIL